MPDGEAEVPFTLIAESVDDACVVWITGEIDVRTAGRVDAAIGDAIDAGRSVVLDMAGVSFMDSSGLEAIIRSRRSGYGLVLRNPTEPVMRLLEVTGLLGSLVIKYDGSD